MAHNNPFIRSTLFITAFGLLINLAVATRALSYYGFPGWEKGTLGLELALKDAKKQEKPLILYFHIDSSTWNDRMNDEYLATYDVNEFLEKIPKVHINPDEGDAENAAAAEYGVTQYPAFFVFIPSFNTKPERIHPFSQKDKDMTTEEFINKIKENIVYEYNNKASECVEKKEYETALKYLEISLNYDPNAAYTYYAIGTIYNLLAAEKNDLGLLEKAEEDYSKALKIDPQHAATIEALKTLQQEKEKMRKK